MNNAEQVINGLVQTMSHAARTPILRRPDEYGMEFEDVFFQALDGVVLNAWFIPASSNKLIICNHFSPASRYGYPGHMEQWANPVGEVNFLPRYKALHDAGYNILAYDMRNHGESDDAAGGITGLGQKEWRDVIGSLRFAKVNPRTSGMEISMMNMCMGANSAMIAMKKYPKDFEQVKCQILVQPFIARTMIGKAFELTGVDPDEMHNFEQAYTIATGYRLDEHNMLPLVDAIEIPTLLVQVKEDVSSDAADMQKIYDQLKMKEKEMFWIEGTPHRFHAYSYFSQHPEKMLDWLNQYM